MPATYFRQAQVTYDTGSGGQIPADNRIRHVDSWADALEPRRTPLLQRIKKGKAVNQRPWYWGQSVRIGFASLVAGGGLAQAGGTLTVSTGTGVQVLQKFYILKIQDYVAGTNRLDPAKRELVWCNAEPTADTVAITRGQGGTSDVAHAAGALVEVVGSAEKELDNHPISPFARGFQVNNEFQRFVGGAQADKRVRAMPTYENKTDQLLADIEEVQVNLKQQLEKAIMEGGRQTPTSSVPGMMGGIRQFITTNVEDMGGAILSAYDLEAVVREMAKEVDDGGAKTLLMSYDTAAIWDTLLNPYRRASTDDTSLTLYFERVRLRWGTYEIGVTHTIPDGEIWIVDFKDMSYHPFEGLDWHTKRHETDGDWDWISVSGDFSFKLQREARMALIYNFNNDLEQYPRKEYF